MNAPIFPNVYKLLKASPNHQFKYFTSPACSTAQLLQSRWPRCLPRTPPTTRESSWTFPTSCRRWSLRKCRRSKPERWTCDKARWPCRRRTSTCVSDKEQESLSFRRSWSARRTRWWWWRESRADISASLHCPRHPSERHQRHSSDLQGKKEVSFTTCRSHFALLLDWSIACRFISLFIDSDELELRSISFRSEIFFTKLLCLLSFFVSLSDILQPKFR